MAVASSAVVSMARCSSVALVAAVVRPASLPAAAVASRSSASSDVCRRAALARCSTWVRVVAIRVRSSAAWRVRSAVGTSVSVAMEASAAVTVLVARSASAAVSAASAVVAAVSWLLRLVARVCCAWSASPACRRCSKSAIRCATAVRCSGAMAGSDCVKRARIAVMVDCMSDQRDAAASASARAKLGSKSGMTFTPWKKASRCRVRSWTWGSMPSSHPALRAVSMVMLMVCMDVASCSGLRAARAASKSAMAVVSCAWNCSRARAWISASVSWGTTGAGGASWTGGGGVSQPVRAGIDAASAPRTVTEKRRARV